MIKTKDQKEFLEDWNLFVCVLIFSLFWSQARSVGIYCEGVQTWRATLGLILDGYLKIPWQAQQLHSSHESSRMDLVSAALGIWKERTFKTSQLFWFQSSGLDFINELFEILRFARGHCVIQRRLNGLIWWWRHCVIGSWGTWHRHDVDCPCASYYQTVCKL